MQQTFAWTFDHAVPLFGILILLGFALVASIGKPRRWFHWVGDALAGALVAVSTGALFFFCSVYGALERRVATLSFVGQPDGAVHRISDYRGKVVVLNFWATWCPPCRKEMPDLNRLAAAHPAGDVVVLTISDETWEAIGQYTARSPMSTVVGRFTSDVPEGAIAAMAYRGRPTTLVIDREGHVRKQLVGARDFAFFEETVRTVR